MNKAWWKEAVIYQIYPKSFCDSDGDGSGEAVGREFYKSFGWVYAAKMVAEFENCRVDEVFKMPVLQFLNYLTYIKLKRKVDEAIYNKGTK